MNRQVLRDSRLQRRRAPPPDVLRHHAPRRSGETAIASRAAARGPAIRLLAREALRAQGRVARLEPGDGHLLRMRRARPSGSSASSRTSARAQGQLEAARCGGRPRSAKALLESERAARSRGRADERDEGRVPRDALARAAHAAQRDPRLGADAARRGTSDEDDCCKGLETIERNARVQTQLIEDLLDMSRITSGKLRLDVQPVAAGDVHRGRGRDGAARGRGQGHPARDGARSGGRARSPATRAGCSRSSGTCSPTPSSSRRRAARCRSCSSASNSHIEISVADTGIGIKPEFLPHVFERFRQARRVDDAQARRPRARACRSSRPRRAARRHGRGREPGRRPRARPSPCSCR